MASAKFSHRRKPIMVDGPSSEGSAAQPDAFMFLVARSLYTSLPDLPVLLVLGGFDPLVAC